MNSGYFSSTPSIGCIIMASGMGKRFGSNKLLAEFQGKPMISYILEATAAVTFTRRLVVTRHPAIADLCNALEIDVLLHTKEKRNEAIRLGLHDMASLPLNGCMFCPSDQPLLTTKTIQCLMHSFAKEPDKIHRLCADGLPGSPVIFPAIYFSELMTLPDGKGGGFLTKKYPEQVVYVPVQNPYELYDIDTPKDLAQINDINPV